MVIKLEGETDLLNLKMFDKQMIFSMDENVFSAQYFHRVISDGTIMRYVPSTGILFLTVPKTNEYYSSLKYDLMKGNISFKEKEDMIHIKLRLLSYDKEKSEKLNIVESKIPKIPGVLFYPSVVYFDHRLYFLIQYNSSSSKDLTKYILNINKIFSEVSDGLFKIEEITLTKPISYFLSKYDVNFENLFYMEIIADYVGEIPKMKENENYLIHWPFNDRGDLKIVPFELMVEIGEKGREALYNFGSKLLGSGLPIIYFEGSQFENFRKYVLINIRQRMEIYYELFNSLIESGYKIKIDRFEKISKD